MSASPPPPPPPSPDNQNLDGPRPLEIIAHVSFYTKSQSSTAKGKKGKTSTTKDMRAKEFTYLFAADEHNYLKFLQVILNSHHLVKYVAKHVADQVVFPCKVQVPPAIKANATYIVNFNEFKALATKINKKTISWAIIVTVEMTDIEKVFSKPKKTRSDLFLCSDNEESGLPGVGVLGEQDDDSDPDEDSLGLNKLDYKLA